MQTRCAVCNKTSDEVSLMIQGEENKCLCNSCIEVYSELLASFSKSNSRKNLGVPIMRPDEIKKLIDKKVIGHDKAKIILALAIYDQILKYHGKYSSKKIGNNVIIAGPTGIGKTYLLEVMAEFVNLPMIICDATSYSEVGYSGMDVDEMIGQLFEKADYDVKKTEYGIVFIDEIDKIGRKGDFHSYSRDVSGEGVQQSLLKLIEGKNVEVSCKGRYGTPEKTIIDTSNIMFVFSGAFVGMNEEKHIESALQNYGLIPELVGRMNYLTRLENLSREELKAIVCDVDDSILDMQRQKFCVDNISLNIENSAINYIIEIAEVRKLGVRGLIALFNEIFSEVRYNALISHESNCNVDLKFVKDRLCRN